MERERQAALVGRATAISVIVSLVACGPVPSADRPRAASAATDEHADATAGAPSAPTIEVRELVVEGDGRSVPIALAEGAGGIALFMMTPDGVGRFSIDLDAGDVTRVETVPTDRFANVAAYDRVADRLWWAVAADQVRRAQPSPDGDFPGGELVVTTSSTIANTDGLRAAVRVCPAQAPQLGGGAALCDHEIRVVLPVEDGVVLGGHLAERVGGASAQAWLGLANPDGALVAERRLPPVLGDGWIDALASSEAGVLAVAWNGSREPARATVTLLARPTLEPIATTLRTVPSWVSTPWSAAVAAPGGGFWVALETTRDELALLTIARDGSIAADRPIAGAALPTTSVQSLGVRRGEPWLMIEEPYADGGPLLRLARVDPATGSVPERFAIALPSGFYASRMLAFDRGFLLAGRVRTERPLVVWIPLVRDGGQCHGGRYDEARPSGHALPLSRGPVAWD